MEQTIREAAKQVEEMARTLTETAIVPDYKTTAPEYVASALLQLYYAKTLEEKLQACQAQMSEDTDGETVEAVTAAQQAIDEAADAAFAQVEDYGREEREFAERIEGISLSDEDGLEGLLLKLYKCEGLIRMAYRYSTKYPIYGIEDTLLGVQGQDMIVDPEEHVSEEFGVDVYALIEIRDMLIARIQKAIGELP